MRILQAVLGALNALCLVSLLLLLSVQTPAFNLGFFRYEFRKNGTYDILRMEEQELDGVAAKVIAYLSGGEPPLDEVWAVVDGQGRYFFNEREIFHMEDVRILFEQGMTLRNVSAAGFFATLLALAAIAVTKKRAAALLCLLARMWRGFAIGVFAAFGAFGLFAVISFDRAFTLFHEMLFSNDLWLFNPNTSLMINMLPNAFFTDIALFIGVMYAGLLAVITAAASVCIRKLKP